MAANPGQSLALRLQTVAQQPGQRLVALMLALAATVALVIGAVMWSRTPDYRVLYGNLSDRDGGAVIAALQQMNVPYKFAEGGGALMVAADRVHEARLRLAAQGLPKGGMVGFELMENQKFGASQFLEQVNYQRALEGELARSIQSLAAVQAARVHLALSKPSVFLRDQPKPSASVLLNLYPGRALEANQVAAIAHLVSNSVPDLPAKNVTIVDQNGALLSAESSAGAKPGLDAGQLRYRHELETSYAKRIEAILVPIVGHDNVRAQVSAELDFTETQQADEIYKPNHKAEEAAVRSQQSSETSTSGSAAGGASGVPGALSNQPPALASASVASAAPPAAPGATAPPGTAAAASGPAAPPPSNTRRDTTVNYEVDKSIRHTRQPMGRLKRLSVAVVVNHKKVTDSAGKVSFRPLTNAEKEQLTELVRGVIGFDKARGDTLSVANSAFTQPEREAVPEVPLWKQPTTIEFAKDVGKHVLIAAIVIYFVLGVLRPALRTLVQVVPAPALLPSVESSAEDAQPGNDRYDQTLQAAKQLARQDPKVVANVVKDWVAGNER